jgi:chaperonin GroES
MTIVPLNDKIVVQRLEAEDKTAGGIILPDTAKEKPKQGKILSLGEGKLLDSGKRASFQVKAGDRVLFTSYAGTEVNVDGKEYLVLTEDDICPASRTPGLSAGGSAFSPGKRLAWEKSLSIISSIAPGGENWRAR